MDIVGFTKQNPGATLTGKYLCQNILVIKNIIQKHSLFDLALNR